MGSVFGLIASKLTRWTTTPQLSCRSCATKSQIGGALFSLACGWWGFPWGLVLTPVQVTRNVIAMCAGPDAARPSADLRRFVMVNIAAQAIQNQQSSPPRVLK